MHLADLSLDLVAVLKSSVNASEAVSPSTIHAQAETECLKDELLIKINDSFL